MNLESLAKGLHQLETNLRNCRSDLSAGDPDLAKRYRAVAINVFEDSFEISIKMLRCRLEAIVSSAKVERLPYRDLVRIAAEKGFVDDPSAWLRFRVMHNLTSQSYDETKAEQLAAVLPEFAAKANVLLNALRQ